MKNKKSQLTLFIILGIVLLVIIIGLFFVVSLIRDDKTGETVEQTQKIPSDLQPLVKYVESCLENVAKNGLFLLGKQSGKIYEEQGGKDMDYPAELEGISYINYDGNKLIYLISLPVAGGLVCSPIIPFYPVISRPYPYYSALVGIDMSKGKNYEAKDCFGKRSSISKNRLQENLKSYIESHIQTDCDMSSFKNYKLTFSKPNATLDINQKNTQVTLSYPMDVVDVIKGAKIRLDKFYTKLKFSINDLVDFVDSITQNEVDNPNYEITTSYSSSPFVIRNIPDIYNKDDVIVISSESLSIDGRVFEFYFARKNRYPILESLYNVSFSGIPLTEDYEIKWNDTIKQKLEAVDPDEEIPQIIVKIGADKSSPCMLTNISSCKVLIADYSLQYLTVRIEASDGQFSDYWGYNITG